jgi:hypothetical protein
MCGMLASGGVDGGSISEAKRRARLLARHHLGGTASNVGEAVRSVVAFHSSDPATPYLAARARIAGFAVEDLDRALVEERTLWRLHAMRRTLFVVPLADVPVVEGAAGRGVAARELRKLEGWLAAELPKREIPRFLSDVKGRVLALLADGSELLTAELSAAVPELAAPIRVGSGKWASEVPLASRLLLVMATEGELVRTRTAGSWRSSQYRWASASAWFGRNLEPMDPHAARAALARRYLEAFGPATLDDVRWWTGWTVRETRTALERAGVVGVRLAMGRGEGEYAEGFLLETDTADAQETAGAGAAGCVTFLPALDPTPMGWKHRDWFLGPHAPPLFDRNGNIGPSVWVGGRVVGGWAQRPDGRVVARVLEEAGPEVRDAVHEEAQALTRWLDGSVVTPRFRTPLEKELARGS